MTTTSSSSLHDRTIELGLRALAHVKKHRTSAEPIAYELWYEHAAGHHTKLSTELKARIAAGHVSDSDIRELHANFLSSLRISDRVGEVGASAQAELRAVLETIRLAVSDLAGFDGDLQQAAAALADPTMGGGGLKSIVEALVSTTKTMFEANDKLGSNLQEAQSNISALQLALETTRGEALTDGLTGLPNRRAFDEQLASGIAAARARLSPLSLLMLDIDHFKIFNDTHGHPVGDQVIRLVGSCIKQRLSAPDLPARYGGEEFAVISLGRGEADALALAEDIRRTISSYEVVKQGTQQSLGRVTVSVGIAALLTDDTAADLIARADECLYRAKSSGRNRVNSRGGPVS